MHDTGDEPFTSMEKSWFNSGANKWEAVRDPFGGQLLNVIKDSDNEPSTDVPVLNKNVGGGYGGQFDCATNSIWIDFIDPRGPPLTWQTAYGLAAHEMGHGLDLQHAGNLDSFDTSYGTLPTEMPTMVGCAFPPGYDQADMRSLEQDDWAALEHMKTSGKYNGHANTSFENSGNLTRFWGKGSGSRFIDQSSGSSDGTYHVLLGGTAMPSYMYQTVRVEDPKKMKARVNYKKYFSSSSGQIFYGIYARKVNFPSNPGCASVFENGWDFNDPDVPNLTFEYRVGTWRTPTTSWKWPDTPRWNGVDSWQGVDARLYIFNYMVQGVDPTDVRIDHARIRHVG